MQCEARSQVNQGESKGVDLRPRLKMSPLICQEIAHNAPPQVVFFTKIGTLTKGLTSEKNITSVHCKFVIHIPGGESGEKRDGKC